MQAMPGHNSPTTFSRWPLAGRLALIPLSLVVALCAVSIIGWRALGAQFDRAPELSALIDAQRYFQDADMMHDAVHSDVLSALFRDELAHTDMDTVLADFTRDSEQLRHNVDDLAQLPLSAQLRVTIEPIHHLIETYLTNAGIVVSLAQDDRAAALVKMAAFDQSFHELLLALEEATENIAQVIDRTEESVAAAARIARLWILFGAILAMLATGFFMHAVSRSIRHSLAEVRTVANALTDGHLEARNVIHSNDEIGELGLAFNQLADSMQSMLEKLRADAERDSFGTQLNEALEMVDTEPEVHQVVGRAMAEISPEWPMELLLADSSRANLERAAAHPLAGAPGCRVESPFSCVAVRRGTAVVFDNSESLNSCPRLRHRAAGQVSAVCVPVSFMGRSLGTLHCTKPFGDMTSADKLAQLTALGLQAGARIGTVRAFERTQLRANTDGLTGLLNRRALEECARNLNASGQPYAVVVADLDHFKQLNDTHGHEAGDRALRIFSRILSNALREQDHASRWGGEEFTILLPKATLEDALAVVERIRISLAAAVEESKTHRFTASFGIAHSASAVSFEHLIRKADEALYAAKRGGRDRAETASMEQGSPFSVRMSEQNSAVNLQLVTQEL